MVPNRQKRLNCSLHGWGIQGKSVLDKTRNVKMYRKLLTLSKILNWEML